MSKTESANGGCLQQPCSAAGVESEVCECCGGTGSISYNPNLNPNDFPATAFAVCMHCNGTGSVEQAKPQPNAEAQAHGLSKGDNQK